MKKCPHTVEREKLVAEALRPVATELRLIDAADLVSLVRYERWGNLSDLVSSAAELYFLPGTVKFGIGGDYNLDWNRLPEILLDLEIKPAGVTIYAKLSLTDELAGLEISHIAFHSPSLDADENTAFLARSLLEARFVVPSAMGGAGEMSHSGNLH
ncbi:hypothetical protein JJB09_01365 [Rhizobium sp. KVB221]|uniref:Uncharacterized protein n=1 Tax=Rhizobium setariae TaxID=2801340 RepID=A0A936YQT1_9HYPH|nr:hypothetical protein [Rhizobium setariae]MBL0370665.1 hypothetical protein [Rhizobium setariae]